MCRDLDVRYLAAVAEAKARAATGKIDPHFLCFDVLFVMLLFLLLLLLQLLLRLLLFVILFSQKALSKTSQPLLQSNFN